MLAKKYTIYGLIAIVAVSLGGFSFLTDNVDQMDNSNVQIDTETLVDDSGWEIHTETLVDNKFSGIYPRPPPSTAENIISNSLGLEEVQKYAGFTLLEPTLPKDFVLISATYIPIYDEATIYYAPKSIVHKISNEMSLDDLLDIGVIIIDYERRPNMKNIDSWITEITQYERVDSFDVDGKKGYSVYNDFVNRQHVAIFDKVEGMEIIVRYNEAPMSQVRDIARSLFS